MGGRGSFSSSHGGVVSSEHNAGSFYISGKTEARQDIRTLFIDELGFRELYGTGSIPTAQLAALGIQLKKSEATYKTLANNKVYLAVTSNPSAKGAAAMMGDGSMVMFLNPKVHSSVSKYRQDLRDQQRSGYKTKTDRRITNDFSYTARHEYGHLTQYSISKRTGKSSEQIQEEIRKIASKNNRKTSSPSIYGSKNSREYFAESFASMTGGRPNAHGKALSEWFRQYRRG